MKEIWKSIVFDFEYTNPSRYEISNLGRVRSFNAIAKGRILKGSMTEGYRVLKLKLYRPRTEEKEEEFAEWQCEIQSLSSEYNKLVAEKGYPARILRVKKHLEEQKAKLRKRKKVDLKQRTQNLTLLVHRLVAQYFLPRPKPEETIIGHLDYNKLNNEVENLKWMSPEENKQHQHGSPYVIAEKKQRKYTQRYRKRKEGWKLNSTEVMHIKLLLKRDRPIRRIAKKYEVSETQIRRIKKGENWSHIKLPGEKTEDTKF